MSPLAIAPVLLGTVLSAAPPAAPATAASDPVLRALRTEIDRAHKQLRLDPNPPPYFISAVVSDLDYDQVRATFGTVTLSRGEHLRNVALDLRVGSPALDDSRLVRSAPADGFEYPDLPEEDDELGIRRSLWLAFDGAYKQALEDLARKKAVLEGGVRTADEKLPDWSGDQSAVLDLAPPAEPPFVRADWEARVRRASAVLREFPAIHACRVEIVRSRRLVRYADSDGGAILVPKSLFAIETSAETQADDGMPLHDFASWYGRRADEAPAETEVVALVRGVGTRLAALRAAPVLDGPWSGPLLFEDQAAAELLLALAGSSAAITREPVFEDSRFGMGVQAAPWKGRLGTRVMSELFDVVDDPTRGAWRGMPLIGSYPVDDEGVRAQAVTLVERGKLRAVLATRTPVKGGEHSNGHARGLPPSATPHPAPAVLVVTAANDKPVSPAEVRERYLATLRERGLDHGFAVRRIQNEAASPSSTEELMAMLPGLRGQRPPAVPEPLEVVRLGVDGSETWVRGVRWSGLEWKALRDVLVASSGDGGAGREAGEAAWNERLSPAGAAGWGGQGALPTSIICPRALVLDDVDLAPATGPFAQPPVLARPGFAAAGPAPAQGHAERKPRRDSTSN